MELTTLLTIKRQPDTASSSFPLLSKAGTANPCPPEERHSTANQPMIQAGSQPVCQTGRKATKAPISSILKLPHHYICYALPGLSFCFQAFLFLTYFCPTFLPYIFTCFSSVSYLCSSITFPASFSFFFPLSLCPSAKWVGLQGYNHTRLIAAAKTSMAARAPATV